MGWGWDAAGVCPTGAGGGRLDDIDTVELFARLRIPGWRCEDSRGRLAGTLKAIYHRSGG